MKFDVVVGNSPYQENNYGEKDYAKPIYHLFMNLAYKLSPLAILITPARFLFNAGGTPKEWNNKMLNNSYIKVIMYEANSNLIFPRTDIKGEVVISLYDKNKDFGKIGVYTKHEELSSIYNKVSSKTKKVLMPLCMVKILINLLLYYIKKIQM